VGAEVRGEVGDVEPDMPDGGEGWARCWKGAAEDGGMSVMMSSAPACYPTNSD
jgi:hypothetical protein